VSINTNTNTIVAQTETVKIGKRGIEAVRAFKAAAEAVKAAAAQKAEAEKVIREILGEATTGSFNGVVAVKVIASHNSSIDQKTLLAAFPEAYAATHKETTYSFIKAL
jgi:hypothetical protein